MNVLAGLAQGLIILSVAVVAVLGWGMFLYGVLCQMSMTRHWRDVEATPETISFGPGE